MNETHVLLIVNHPKGTSIALNGEILIEDAPFEDIGGVVNRMAQVLERHFDQTVTMAEMNVQPEDFVGVSPDYTLENLEFIISLRGEHEALFQVD